MASADGKKNPQGSGPDYWGECFRVVYSLTLAEALGNKLSLVPGDSAICTLLLLQDEATTDDIVDVGRVINKLPSLSFPDSSKLFKDCLMPFVSFRTSHCFMKSGGIR